jgi:class 3 adenylate cyclase
MSRLVDEQVVEPVSAPPDPPRRAVPSSVDTSVLPPGGIFLGLEVSEASATRAVTTMPTTEWFCNTQREVEPGIAATQGTLTGSLLHPHILDADQRAVTFETTTSFLGAAPADGRPLVSTATLLTRRDDVFVIEADAVDADGQTVLLARGTLLARQRRPSRASRPSSRTLLTVLFTDVVGSTERASQVGDARWRELLDEHHAVVRRQIEIHMGREVKTTGDGFLATFDSPSRAVECAVALRDHVGRLGLQIRAGLHTGECEVVGADVAGVAVHVASRVQSSAQPGEVLVSSTVRDLTAGSSTQFVCRGSYELKGLDGEWTLFAVVDPSSSFAPAPSDT